MTAEQIAAPEAAALLQASLERLDWRFSLTGAGELHVIIGDCPPRIPQAAVLEVIAHLEDEFKAHLRAPEQ